MQPKSPPQHCGFNPAMDKLLSQTMQNYVSQYLIEAPIEQERRKKALDAVEKIISDWVWSTYSSTQKQWMTNYSDVNRLAFIQPYGSYLLNVHTPGSDIDSVVLLPFYVDSKTFFDVLPPRLKQDPRAKQVEAITKAKHPILTLVFDDVELDLQPLILADAQLTKDMDFLNEDNFKNVKAKMKEVAASVAANMWIKKETQKQEATFNTTIRFLKQVLQETGISGNKFGYFGGINLTLMMCHLMREMYNEPLSPWQYLYNFFYAYGRYNYSIPIVVNQDVGYIQQQTPMQIITPVKPEINSTAKVTDSTCRVIKKVFQTCQRNMEIIMEYSSQVMKIPANDGLLRKLHVMDLIFSDLSDELKPCIQQFFSDSAFKAGYLYIQINSNQSELLQQTKDKIEPLIVNIFTNLQRLTKEETGGQANIDYIRPYPVWFDQNKFKGTSAYCYTLFIGISKTSGEKEWLIKKLKEIIFNFKSQIRTRLEQEEVSIQSIVNNMVVALKGGKELRQLVTFE
ncbi:Poly(A) polymerase [Spironucleus salmonicida]|uniref:polynucleotide adenylyltransferase n=1 Tax=Spironucleus salmonicida TaxID=348837 RepID=V6M0H0_9EUKA|nr:Poly(A) polymerase [Spironucleus salmonicida]|eukprot:EST46629.1 Poly(A) polymerase [Spironucleus salmonicida]